MAKERTSKSRYVSSYTDGYISGIQWLAEKMCERKAAQEGSGLCHKFWETETWKMEFRMYVATASRIVKKFGFEAVAAAMKRKDVEWCASFAAKQFQKAVVLEKRNLEAAEKPREAVPVATSWEGVSSVAVKKKTIREL